MCQFKPGDVVGWYHLGQGVSDFDHGAGQGHHDVIWNYPVRNFTVTFYDNSPI